jgi:hypothetical protein
MRKMYGFVDYLCQAEGFGWRWGYFLLPVLYLGLGDDIPRNIREMPRMGWLVIGAFEAIICVWLYARYAQEGGRKAGR